MNKFQQMKELLDYLFGTLYRQEFVRSKDNVDRKNSVIKTKQQFYDFLINRKEYCFQTKSSDLKKIYFDEEGVIVLDNCSFFHRPTRDRVKIDWEREEELDLETAFFEYVVKCPPLDLGSVRLVSGGEKPVYKADDLDLDKPIEPRKEPAPKRPNRPKPGPHWLYSPTKAPSIHKPRGAP